MKEGAPYVMVNLILLMAQYGTGTDLLSISTSHSWLSAAIHHMALYRNRPSLVADLCLLHRAMELVASPTVLACHLKGLLDSLLSTLQFWQPVVQVSIL